MVRTWPFLAAFVVSMPQLNALAAEEAPALLTKENEPYLCTQAAGSSSRLVSRTRLARLVVTKAGVLPDLLDGNTGRSGDGLTDDEYLFAVQHTLDPFGPTNYPPTFVTAQRKSLETFVESLNRILTDQEGKGLYTLVGASLEREISALELFNDPPLLQIACNDPSGPATEVPSKVQRVDTTLPPWLRIRGSVEELNLEQSQLHGSDGFELGLLNDLKGDDREVSVNGVLGVELSDENGSVRYVPYLGIDWTEYSDETKTDVRALTPGFLLDLYGLPLLSVQGDEEAETGVGTTSAEIGIAASLTDDLEQDSRKGVLSAFLQPTIQTKAGQLFGTYLKPLGPFYFRPELSLLAESAWVFASGDSAQLAGAQSYLGLGGELSLKVRLPGVPLLSGFTGRVGVRDLNLVAGDLPIDDVRRWSASLTYNPNSLPFIGLKFSYENGDHETTFQNEEYYRAGVSIQF